MIADARTFRQRRESTVLGSNGKPFVHEPRFTSADLMQRKTSAALQYDAAQDNDNYRRYWAYADSRSPDNANSIEVRRKLVSRSRYEAESNPYYAGILDSHTHYLVGTGPKLRMQTNNKGFNETIQGLWNAWWAETGMGAKLWAMAHAKTQDGEAFALLVNNPNLRTGVQLDVVPIETEQCQTPGLWGTEANYIDGIKFDEFGNPEHYDILDSHPGGDGISLTATPVPASNVLHWFRQRRPGQHRGVPEMTSSLNCGASFRRWRDSTLKAADRAASFSILLKTDLPPDEADFATPFSTAEMTSDMMTALPMSYEMQQVKAEHPNAAYDVFHKTQISEQARPLGMPRNIAACDSSTYNFASGRLDHISYAMSLEVEREDCISRVLDKLFRAFWAEAVLAYGFSVAAMPAHTWDLPQNLTADVRAEAIANNFGLRNGSRTLSQVYVDQGYDAAEQLQKEADLLGVPIEEYKRRVFDSLFPPTPAAQPNAQDASDAADREELQNQAEEAASNA